MSVLVIVEHDSKSLNPALRNVASAALKISSDFDALVIGHDCQNIAKQASFVQGCNKVILIDSLEYKHQLTFPESLLYVTELLDASIGEADQLLLL